MSDYFLKPKSLEINVKVELDLSNYATKENLKDAIGADTLDLAKGAALDNLKPDASKLDTKTLKMYQVV